MSDRSKHHSSGTPAFDLSVEGSNCFVHESQLVYGRGGQNKRITIRHSHTSIEIIEKISEREPVVHHQLKKVMSNHLHYPSDGAAQTFFRPEFYNRIDAVLNFHPLDEKSVRQIIEKELASLTAREGLAKRGIKLSWTSRLVEHLAQRGFSSRFGARPFAANHRNEGCHASRPFHKP